MTTSNERPRSASAPGRVWLWVRRILLALVGLIVLLLLLGLLYQFLATRLAYRNYPAPGEMVSVSGHDMHIYCTGKAGGGPTVVMDAGLGGGVLDWQTVQPKVASFSRVCSYDRSGIGWSESLSRARADKQINEFEASRQDLSENSELVVAKNSAHYIHFERPELVVDSIRRVVNAARWHGL